MGFTKRFINLFFKKNKSIEEEIKEMSEEWGRNDPESYKEYLKDPDEYIKNNPVEEFVDPHRKNVTQENFYKRILYENYSTYGYYYVSGHTPKEDQNIWVHDIDEESRIDTRIKFSESDVNVTMTTDEFKKLIEDQDYESSESVEVVGKILKEMNIPFVLREVVLD